MSKTTSALLLTVAGALAVLGTAGCATKGYVNNEIKELRNDMGADREETRFQIDGMRESAEKALRLSMGVKEQLDEPWAFRQVGMYKVNFAFDSATLSDGTKSTLDQVSAALRANPGYHAALYGHADTTGDEWYNDMLSESRAKNVVRYLVAGSGASLSRFTIIGMGESEPLSNAADSRRVAIHLMEPSYQSVGSPVSRND